MFAIEGRWTVAVGETKRVNRFKLRSGVGTQKGIWFVAAVPGWNAHGWFV